MLQYNVPCSKGAPPLVAELETLELESFAVLRGEDSTPTGILISDDELPSPVIKLFFDPQGYKIWILPDVPGHAYFISTDVVPLDVLDFLSKTTKPVSVYAVHSQESTDTPEVHP